MRSRLAITALLTTGVLMSSGGAALGVSALSTDLRSSSAQYGSPVQQAPSGSAGTGDAGETLGGTQDTEPSGTGSESDAAPNEETSSTPTATATATAQAPRQIEASTTDELPFTGFAAIPLLLMGLGLLAAGIVLRRGTRRGPTQP